MTSEDQVTELAERAAPSRSEPLADLMGAHARRVEDLLRANNQYLEEGRAARRENAALRLNLDAVRDAFSNRPPVRARLTAPVSDAPDNTPAYFLALARENAALRAGQNDLSQVMQDTADELGCAADNEEILLAIAALRTERDALREAIRTIDRLNDNPATYNAEINRVIATHSPPAQPSAPGPMTKIYPFNSKDIKEPVRLEFSKSQLGQNVLEIKGVNGEHLTRASVCMDEPQAPGEIFIKIWSENEGILDALLATGALADTGRRIKRGPFAEVAVCRIIQPAQPSAPDQEQQS